MKIPTRTQYALMILLDLSINGLRRPSKVADIAARQGIPRQFLHQILLALKTQGMVRSVRGLHGGYLLAKKPREISMASVVQATVGDVSPTIESSAAQQRPVDDVIQDAWRRIYAAFRREMETVTIDDLQLGAQVDGIQEDYAI